MQVSMISTSRFQNNYSPNNDPMERIKQNIEKQIEQEKQSKDSNEVKTAKLKTLEDNLKQVTEEQEKQKAQELVSGESDTAQKNNENVDNSNKTEEQQKADANTHITKGLLSVSSHLKTSKVSFNVYKDAELKGDSVTAERALKYTNSEVTQAKKDLKLVEKGLKEYKKQLENRDNEISNNKQGNKNSANTKDVKNNTTLEDTANTKDTTNTVSIPDTSNNNIQASQDKALASDAANKKQPNNTTKIDVRA